MAELKPDKRQVGQPSAPDISGAGQAYGNLGKVIQAGAKTVGDYVDSANKVEASLLLADTASALDKEFINNIQPDNIALGNAYGRSIEKGRNIVDASLEHVPKKYYGDVKAQLDQHIRKTSFQVAAKEYTYNQNEMKARGQAALFQFNKDLENAALEGDQEAIDISEKNILETVTNLLNMGAFTSQDAQKALDGIQDARNKAVYTSKFAELLRTDDIAAAKLLKELAEEKPSYLTQTEWFKVQNDLYQQMADYNRAISAIETIGRNELNLAIDEGRVRTNEDLNNFSAQKESEGRVFSYNDRLNAQDKLAGISKKESKDAELLAEISATIKSNPDALYNYSKADLNKYYLAASAQMNEAYAEQQALNPDMPVPSQLMVKGTIASHLPIAVEPFNREFSDKLTRGSIQDFDDALRVGRYLSESSPGTFAKLPKETQAYFEKANNLRNNTTLQPEYARDIAAQMLKPKDTATQEIIDKKLGTLHRSSYYKSLYKEVYDTKFVNPSLQPQFNNMVKVYDDFFQISGDKDMAERLTKNYMVVKSGKSTYVPKNDITKNPLEKTAIYKQNPTLAKNQIAVGVFEIIRNTDAAIKDGRKMVKVEWSDKVKQPDWEKITEDEFNKNPIFVNHKGKEVEPQFKIDGKNRKILLMNPNVDLEDDSRDQRQFYYEDDFGNPFPIYVVDAHGYNKSFLASDSGIAAMEFKSEVELTPNAYTKKKEIFDEERAVKHLREEFKANNPKPDLRLEADKNKLPAHFKDIEYTKRSLEREEKQKQYVASNLPKRLEEIKKADKNNVDKILGGLK